jgi:Domain of unknown function (DUF222)
MAYCRLDWHVVVDILDRRPDLRMTPGDNGVGCRCMPGSIELMFEAEASSQLVVGVATALDDAAVLDDAGVIDALGSAARAENAACGRRLMWMGELYARRAPADDVERVNWAIDGHANAVAEVSAALNISRGRAAGQLQFAIALRVRLPQGRGGVRRRGDRFSDDGRGYLSCNPFGLGLTYGH